jgi:hypothetical protein
MSKTETTHKFSNSKSTESQLLTVEGSFKTREFVPLQDITSSEVTEDVIYWLIFFLTLR